MSTRAFLSIAACGSRHISQVTRVPPLIAACTPLPNRTCARQTLRFYSEKEHLRDENIPYSTARVVDPVTNQLSPPVSLKELVLRLREEDRLERQAKKKELKAKAKELKTMKKELKAKKTKKDDTSAPPPKEDISDLLPKRRCVELVAEKPEPVVKIVDLRSEYWQGKDSAKEKEAARLASGVAKAPGEKELQMSWGVARGDLHHKLQKAREALQQGHRISVVYTPKKGQPLPSKEDMRQKVQDTMDLLSDVGQEWKALDIHGHTAIICLKSAQATN